METTQPAASPLGLLLIVAIIYLIFKSPKKLQTFVGMVIAFLVTVLVVIIPGTILHTGDPQAQGRIAGLAALLIALIVGWWHLRSLKRASTAASAQPPQKM